MAVASMHGVGAGSERFTLPPSVGGVSGGFAVDDIGSDREHALGVRRVPVGRMFADLLHEACDEADGDLIDPVVIVAELGRRLVAFILVVDHKSGSVPHGADLAILDGAEAVGDHRKTGYPE